MNLSSRDLEDIRAAREMLASGEAQRLRERSSLTRAEVATFAGSSVDAVQLWEGGQRCPRTEHALRLGRLYRRLLAEQGAPT